MIFDNGFVNDYDLALKKMPRSRYLVDAPCLRKGLVSAPSLWRSDKDHRSSGIATAPTNSDGLVQITRVVSGDNIHLFFPGLDEQSELIQPASIDVIAERFYNSSGKQLPFPVTLSPKEFVSCESDLEIELTSRVFSCLETKSSVARVGLAAVGFECNGNYEIFLKNYSGRVRAVLANYSPNSVVVDGPRSFFQLTVSEHSINDEGRYFNTNYLDIMHNGKSTLEESRVVIGNLLGYVLHIASDVWCMGPVSRKVNFDDRKNANGLFSRGKLGEVDLENVAFCLTRSREKIFTNGFPAYVFPFHIKDVRAGLHEHMSRLESLKEAFVNVFVKSDGSYLPITANAGLCNPGWYGHLVFENIMAGVKGVNDYFKPGEPFALLVPMPFAATSRKYNGSYNGQRIKL